MQKLVVSRVALDIEVKIVMNLLPASPEGEVKTLLSNERAYRMMTSDKAYSFFLNRKIGSVPPLSIQYRGLEHSFIIFY